MAKRQSGVPNPNESLARYGVDLLLCCCVYFGPERVQVHAKLLAMGSELRFEASMFPCGEDQSLD